MNLDLPPAWVKLDLSGISGVVMVVGAPDTGKSTFTRYLFERLQSGGARLALLDGDPGQSSLGPPGTMTIALAAPGEPVFPPTGQAWRWFVGSTSPSGHMLAVLVGAQRLIRAAGAKLTIYDTSGLIDPTLGGTALKFAKIDLLQPVVVFAIQKDQELEPLLQPLRRSRRTRLIVLAPSAAARRRNSPDRQAYRAGQFAHYFQSARRHALDWSRYGVFPYPQFVLNRLLALEDENGFALALGVIQAIDRPNRRIEVLSPLASLEGVASLHLGDLILEPGTFRDRRL